MNEHHHDDHDATPYERFVYWADFVIYPALVVALFIYDRAALGLAWGAMFAFGFIVWTLAEYWIHRLVLHGPYWMDIHERHHNRPREQVVFPIWQIPAYFLASFIVLSLIFGAWTPPVFAGFVLGWIGFFGMHHVMHQLEPRELDAWGLLAFARRHNLHHKVTDANYGITTDFWDRVFGTFRDVKLGR